MTKMTGKIAKENRTVQPVLEYIKIINTNGTSFISETAGKNFTLFEGDNKSTDIVNDSKIDTNKPVPKYQIRLDIDPYNHRAWNPDASAETRQNVGNVAKFKAKFGSVDLFSIKKKSS